MTRVPSYLLLISETFCYYWVMMFKRMLFLFRLLIVLLLHFFIRRQWHVNACFLCNYFYWFYYFRKDLRNLSEKIACLACMSKKIIIFRYRSIINLPNRIGKSVLKHAWLGMCFEENYYFQTYVEYRLNIYSF